jgi:NAD(P)-dependent dehydrogenase (short-subunit alcohol dehydrogenase family)
MGWLEGYATLVTGGTSGIGAAVVARYVQEGANVVVLDRDGGRLRALAERFPGRVVPVEGDVRDHRAHETAVAAALTSFGKLDVLVANAGVFDFNRPLASYDAASLAATMDELFAINVRGYLYAAMAAREALTKGSGSIICTASIAGLHAGCGGTVYTLAKHAVVGLIRQLALEFAPAVRVNGVGPGGTLTDLRGTEALGHGARSIAARYTQSEARIAESVPLKIAQRPEDHTGLYVLLASRENARAITGELLMSDGGVGVRGV